MNLNILIIYIIIRMSEKIHKISESSPDLIKKLDKDKKFKFECEVCDK